MDLIIYTMMVTKPKTCKRYALNITNHKITNVPQQCSEMQKIRKTTSQLFEMLTVLKHIWIALLLLKVYHVFSRII